MKKKTETAKKNLQKSVAPMRAEPPFMKWFPAGIFVFAILLYVNTLPNGFVMDDGAVITDNVTVKKGFTAVDDLFRESSVYGSTGDNYGSYRPFTMTLFAIEWELFGNDALPYHAVHIFLYALCCVIIFLTLKKLLHEFHPLLPAAAVLLFVAHPVHTEVAANLKSTDEIMSLLLCFSSLWFYLKYAEDNGKGWLGAGWLCYFAAVFSKESSLTFLFIIPLAMAVFSGSGIKKLLIIFSFNFAAAAIYLWARNVVLDEIPGNMPVIDNVLVSATSFSEKYGTIFYFLFYYIRLLIFPHPLTWEYGYNQVPLTSFGNPVSLLSLAVHLALLAYASMILIKKFNRKIAADDNGVSVLLAFFIFFYLISLSLYTNIFAQIASNMAERFLFTPLLAFCISLAVVLLKISKFEIAGIKNGNPKIFATLLLLLLVPYSVKTIIRNEDWESNLTLFAAGVKTSPNSYRAHSAYAWENLRAGETEKSPEKKKAFFTTSDLHFRKAVEIYGKVPNDQYNIGVANYYLGNGEAAEKAYRQAAQMNNHPRACYNLGVISLTKKDYANSLKYFLLAYKGDSVSTDAAFKVGLNYHYLNELQNAIVYYEKFYRRHPDNKDVVTNLSIAYAALGNEEKKNFYQNRLQQLK